MSFHEQTRDDKPKTSEPASPQHIRVKCAASEVISGKNGVEVAASGIDRGSVYVPNTRLMTRTVICNACFEALVFQQAPSPSNEIIDAMIPKCAIAARLNESVSLVLTGEPVTNNLKIPMEI